MKRCEWISTTCTETRLDLTAFSRSTTTSESINEPSTTNPTSSLANKNQFGKVINDGNRTNSNNMNNVAETPGDDVKEESGKDIKDENKEISWTVITLVLIGVIVIFLITAVIFLVSR